MHVLFLTDIEHNPGQDSVFGEIQALADQRAFMLTSTDFETGYNGLFEGAEPPKIVLIDLRNVESVEAVAATFQDLTGYSATCYVLGADCTQKEVARAQNMLVIEKIESFIKFLDEIKRRAGGSHPDGPNHPTP